MTALHQPSVSPSASVQEPTPRSRARLTWALLLALYGTFLWRTPYSLKSLPLYVLDWLAPAIGLGTWLVWRWHRRVDWPDTALDAPLVAWLAAVSFSTDFSTHPRNSLSRAWETFTWMLILWLLADTVRRGWKRTLWQVTYLVGGTVCLIGAVEFLAWYFGWPLLPTFQQRWPAVGGLADPVPPTLHRLSFTLVNSTALSAFGSLLIPPAIGILAVTRHRDTRFGMGLWLAGAALVLFLSLSRGGFLALGVSLPAMSAGATRSPAFRRWWNGRTANRTRTRLLAVGLVFVPIVFALAVLGTTRLAEHGSGDAVRLDLWRSALVMFRDHPLAGVGPDAFGPELRAYRQPLLACDHVSTAHNLYLNTAAEMGLPGIVSLLWLLSALARAWWRRWRALAPGSPAWWQCLGIGAALAGFSAQLLVDTFVEPAVLLPATFLAAQILEPLPAPIRSPARPRRWPWAAALALLVLGGAGLAWDTWGYRHFAQSLTWTRRNDLARALSAAERARQHDPGMPLYSCHAGYLLGVQATDHPGDALPPALERYQDCLDDQIPPWLDQLNMAALWWQAGNRTKALAAVRQATTSTPLEWLPWFNRGLWAEQTGERSEAVASYGWVLALDPDLAGSPFWRQEDRAAWWDDIRQAGEKTAGSLGNEPDAWRWQVLVAAGRWDETIQEAGEWLIAHPDDTETMIRLAEAWLGQGHPSEALVWSDRALAASPSTAAAYRVRGEARLALDRLDEAERDLRTALFLEPTPRLHLDLARLAVRRGDEPAALREYARALRPWILPQGYQLVLYRRLGWPGLLPQVTRIGYRFDQEAALEWGELLERKGDPAMAQKVYTAALALDSYLDDVRARLTNGGAP